MTREEKESSRTLQLLEGREILLTGTTGFVGKVVLEKLMRLVPNVGAVHLLIRGNRQYADAQARFINDIASSSVFDRLRQESPQQFEHFCRTRIHCVTGEATAARFGLQRDEFMALAERLDAVINCAASVNFREELDQALAINTFSLRHIAELVELAGNIPVVQVSTCYVNGFHQGVIREEIISPTGTPLPRHDNGYYEVAPLIERLLAKIEQLRVRYQDSELKRQLVELGAREAQAHGWNDTYTFTKWLGEQLLLKSQRDYSLTILRPSIIESAWQEPAPGWIEGVKVADAILLAYARGKVSFFPGRRSAVIDVIPADLVANSILLSLAEQFDLPGEHRIYQCCSGSSNPLTMGQFIDHVVAEGKANYRDYDRLFSQRPRHTMLTLDRRVFTLLALCLRNLFGMIESVLKSLGLKGPWKPRKNLDTALELSTIFSFYAQPNYVFKNDKLLELAERMGPVDRKLFPVDAAEVDWQHYLRRVHMAGLNRYALKPMTARRRRVGVSAKKAVGAQAA